MRSVRRSLQISTSEGIAAELVGATVTGSVLTAWALYLEFSPLLVGVLGALPFAAQLAQIPCAWLTRVHGSKRTAVIALRTSRSLPLLLVPLPFVPLPLAAKQMVLLVFAALWAVLGVAGNNGWTTWMAELVPESVRGRYFGLRTAFCAAGSALGGLSAGFILDAARHHGKVPATLSALSVACLVCGIVTLELLKRQGEGAVKPLPRPRLRDLSRAFADRRVRRALAFHAAWAAASGLASPVFYDIYMARGLHAGFARLAMYDSALAILRIATAPLWGKAIDRVGSKPVLLFCCFGLSLSPVMWLVARENLLWPIAIDAIFCGALLAGQSLASFSLPLAISSVEGRAFQLAGFATAAGAASAVASVAGGALVAALPGRVAVSGIAVSGVQLLFVASGALRVCAAALALRIEESGARTVRTLGRMVLSVVRLQPSRAPACANDEGPATSAA
jgi:MFS family permease